MKTKKKVFVMELRSVLTPFVVLAIFIAALFQSCQSNEEENWQNVPQLKAGSLPSKTTEIYYGHDIFKRDAGKPVSVKKKLGNQSLIRFKPDDFILHITNGDGKTSLVSSAIIKVDGQIIFNTSDFSKKTVTLAKGLSALTDNSELEVELRSDPGSFIDLWIEGTLKPLPELTTNAVTGITGNSAICGGMITSDGGTSISVRGVCWSTTALPTIADSKTTDGTGIGSFTSSLTGLVASTTYYVRAYATNSVGTAYGNVRSFVPASEGNVTAYYWENEWIKLVSWESNIVGRELNIDIDAWNWSPTNPSLNVRFDNLSAVGDILPNGLFSDDFNDGIINPSIWNISKSPGATIIESNGFLDINVPAGMTPEGFNQVGGIRTKEYLIQGNFDIQVDFEVNPEYHYTPNTNAKLFLTDRNGNGLEISLRYRQYLARELGFNSGGTIASKSTMQNSGKLRLVRNKIN